MALKPDKFGLKFWVMTDCETKYVCNAMPYLGRDPTNQVSQNVPRNVVLKLANPYLNRGHEITTDNFFTSVKLAEALKEKRTTLLGTIKKIC